MIPVIRTGTEQRAWIKDRGQQLDLRQRNPVVRLHFLRRGVQERMCAVPGAQQTEHGRTIDAIGALQQRCRRHNPLANQNAG
jgi:hypothetical protein